MKWAEERAVSEVIGAVLIFGFLIIAFTIYQGVFIPQQNKAIEFDHNEDAQDAIQDLRNAIRQTATTAAEESVSITLGATYPPRVLGINPGASAGTIQTESLPPISVRNVSALDPETADYIGAATTTLGSFETKAVVYRPIYFQYTNSPDTLYENSLAYNQFSGGTNLTITNQGVIDDRKITLIALDGNVSEARQGTISIDTKALSTASNTVSVSSDSGPINITIGTRLTAEDWNETLAGELTGNGGHVVDVRPTGPNQVSIILEEGITYDLRLAKVGVGDDTSPEGPKYIVDIEGDNTSVIENGTQKLLVEVRDRFNNPVSNVTVEANVTKPANGGATSENVSPLTATTQADGRATFTYTAPDDVSGAQEADINMTFDGDGTIRNETVTFDVRVLDADGSGGTGGGGSGGNNDTGTDEINPGNNPDGDLVLSNAEEVNSNKNAANLTFDIGSDRNVTKIRVPFYLSGGSGGTDKNAEKVDTFAGRGFVTGSGLDIGDPITELSSSVAFNAADGTKTVDIVFSTNQVQTRGDFFILVLEFEDGNRATYFVAPE